MFEKWGNHHLLLLASLTVASSAGFAQTQDGQNEQATFLSKSLEMLKSSGVATLSLGPVWESAGNTQTFYLAPNIEKTYAANHASHALFVSRALFFSVTGQVHRMF